jgi:hypothetical protein
VSAGREEAGSIQEVTMNPSISRELMMARQQDRLRAAASGRLAAQATRARKDVRPARPAPVVRPARPFHFPQLRKLLIRLLPA